MKIITKPGAPDVETKTAPCPKSCVEPEEHYHVERPSALREDFGCGETGCTRSDPHIHAEPGPPDPETYERETGAYSLDPLPKWVHLREQAGDPGRGHILKLRDEDRSYEQVVEGRNDQLAEMIDYLEAGERFLHGPRT